MRGLGVMVYVRSLNLCVLGGELTSWDSLLPVVRSHLACANGGRGPFGLLAVDGGLGRQPNTGDTALGEGSQRRDIWYF